jgi:nucleoside-diphosphate-sugar epimerase/pimeloyl-ACP methyl ester carboxylesterase
MNHALVTGATGLIGRWLIPELTRLDRDVVALVRRADERRAEFLEWVTSHGGVAARVTLIEGDLAAPGLGLDDEGRRLVGSSRDVFHAGALMQFGMTEAVARRANVEGTRTLIELVRSPALRRFVHISGFKVGDDVNYGELGIDPEAAFDPAIYTPLYATLGSYEASKTETDHLVRDAARRHGFALTRIHPGAVIGDSRTGETTQFFGFAPIVQAVWLGKMAAIPGSARHWLPLISVDFVAAFMARIPEFETVRESSYILLDDTTPQLAELVSRIAERVGVAAPHRRLPIGLVKTLISTGLVGNKGEDEGLAFIADRRYDASPTRRRSHAMGLAWPSLDTALARCIDFLIATRFGTNPAPAQPAILARVAGAPTFVVGDRATPEVLLLHGLPLDADSWTPVANRIGGRQLRADLPGLGRSASVGASPLEWMESLLADAMDPMLLVGHSLGTRYALELAVAHPERVAGLVLISPFFLQALPPSIMRWAPSARLAARGMRRRHLEALVSGDAHATTPVLDGPAADLKRPGARARFGQHLADAHHHRAQLQASLATLEIPVLVIFGTNDPLIAKPGAAEVLEVAGTGHFPQLHRPELVAEAIEKMRARVAAGARRAA